jgi:hypothetical protein
LFIAEKEPFPRDAQLFGQNTHIMTMFRVAKDEDEKLYDEIHQAMETGKPY